MTSKISSKEKEEFKKAYLEVMDLNNEIVKDDPRVEFKHEVKIHRFGPQSYGALVHVPWRKVFAEGICPACQNEGIEDKEGFKVCSKCRFQISQELYQKAKEREDM
ncbi:hypothetical protein ACFLRC_02135, partial [Candidatus Altiarchaeota archaeon]